MTKHYKLTLAALVLLLSAFASATVVNAQLAPEQPLPKVVFIGDYITYQWTSAFAANPNWINKGNPAPLYLGSYGEGAAGVLASFQSDVVSLHPAAVHILIGLPDAVSSHDPTFSTTVPYFLTALNSIVQEAKAANIKVILGLEPNPALPATSLPQIYAVIASYGAANNIPVINYADALCNCVSSVSSLFSYSYFGATGDTVNGFPIAGDNFNQYGGGAFIGPSLSGSFSASPAVPWDDDFIVTPTGYNLMTQMAESTINTMNLRLVTGWLSNVEQADENTGAVGGPLTNVNTVYPPTVLKFIPIGYYSDGSQHPMLNTTIQGSSGTWTSSNPLVMYINQDGLAWAVSQGTAIIRYTSPTGVVFSEWVMYVQPPILA